MEVMQQLKEEINDQGRLEKSVHFDKDGGMWKCHDCIWTYTIGSPSIDNEQNSFTFGTRGTKFAVGPSGTKDVMVEFSPAEKIAIDDLDIRKILTAVIDHHNEENVKVENSRKQDTGFEILSLKAEEHVHLNLGEESEEEVIELEFERAVQKLDTHSMYCPTCNSCVTKVILRRRKKPIEPVHLLGCLSCFSIFIPSGTASCFSIFIPSAKPNISSEPKGSKTLEILKSIVYGGLVESITSLSVVSSAAAADATTLNIVVLGLANLIGGFSLVGHKLWELKDDYPEKITNETTNEKSDRYQQLLGRRENFLLHATVAVLSFLIFGLIPPITYGFSFRKSDDKDFKLVVVAAASLACVAILAIGKAHIQKPPKFYMYIKTVFYYLSTAIVASGISYVVGDLIKKLMEKLGLFESSGAVALSFPGMGSVNPAWGTY